MNWLPDKTHCKVFQLKLFSGALGVVAFPLVAFNPAWHSSRIHLAEMHLIFFVFHPLASFFMISLDGSIPANAEKIKLERRRNKFEFKSDGKECTLHIASETVECKYVLSSCCLCACRRAYKSWLGLGFVHIFRSRFPRPPSVQIFGSSFNAERFCSASPSSFRGPLFV